MGMHLIMMVAMLLFAQFADTHFVQYVDLMLVHFPPRGNDKHCGAMQEQWRAMEDFYKAKKARAIGVSNYCPSSFECILKVANVTPAVNQVEVHIGMGADPE